jgi:hypothetical protein
MCEALGLIHNTGRKKKKGMDGSEGMDLSNFPPGRA